MLLSTKYDEAVQDINQRLSEISETLQAISARERPSGSSRHLSSPLHGSLKLKQFCDEANSPQCLGLRGETSFRPHARNMETLVRFSPWQNTAAGTLQAPALSSFGQTVDYRSELQNENGQDLLMEYPQLAGLPLPPLEISRRLLRFAHEEPQRLFTDIPVIDVADLNDVCQSVYLTPQKASMYDWITTNAGLLQLLTDLDPIHCGDIGLQESETEGLILSIESTCMAAIHTLRLSLAPSVGACRAISLLVSHTPQRFAYLR